MRIGFVHTLLTAENKMLIEAARARNLHVEKISDAERVFDIHETQNGLDVVLQRSSSYLRGIYATAYFEQASVPVVNTYKVQRVCGDKAITSLTLARSGVPTPKTLLAFTRESALAAMHRLSYPVVLKPVIGSWARGLAKINDNEAASAVLNDREELGTFMHKVYYVQEYVNKPGRDIRAVVLGSDVLCAIYRNAPPGEWITNTARGGVATNCPITPELEEVCARVSRTVGEGVLGVDLMESEEGFLVHEVNHTLEFRNSIGPTGVDIAGNIIDYTIKQAKS